jgi:hypothetical protein
MSNGQSNSVPVVAPVVAAASSVQLQDRVHTAEERLAEQAQQLQNLSERLRVAVSDAQVATQLLADREKAYRDLSSEVEVLRAHNAILSQDKLLLQERLGRAEAQAAVERVRVSDVALEHTVVSAVAPRSSQHALALQSTLQLQSDDKVHRSDAGSAALEHRNSELTRLVTDSHVELERLLSLSQKHENSIQQRDADIQALLATIDRTAEEHVVQSAALQASLNQMKITHADALATRTREHDEKLAQLQQQHSQQTLQLQTDCDRMLSELRSQHAEELKNVQAETATHIQHVLTQRNARAKQYRNFHSLSSFHSTRITSPHRHYNLVCGGYVSRHVFHMAFNRSCLVGLTEFKRRRSKRC